MVNIIETLKQAKKRINPEGLAISATLEGASILAVPALQIALTYTINEISKGIPTDLIKLTALGLLACVNIASIIVESKTLKKQQYCASPGVSIVNIAIGKPVVSSILGHGANFLRTYVLNPVNFANVISMMSGDQGRLFAENALGVGLSLGLWNIGFNSLILNHRVDPVVKKMRNIRETVSKHFRRR